MKKIGLIIALAAMGAGPAYADNFPVPSFDDFPEFYAGQHAAVGASAPTAESRPAAPAMDYGPWITLPSSGA